MNHLCVDVHRELYASLAFQMCTYLARPALNHFWVSRYVTKEVGIKTSEVEPLTFFHVFSFSESQFEPFTSARAPKCSSFKIRGEGEILRKLRGGYGRGMKKWKVSGLFSTPSLGLDFFPLCSGWVPWPLLFPDLSS